MLLKVTLHNKERHPFSRSYGANLPSSLMVIISTPEHSLPVYLCRFAVRLPDNLLEAFLVSVGSTEHTSSYELVYP